MVPSMNRCPTLIALSSASLIYVVGCGANKGITLERPVKPVFAQQTNAASVARQDLPVKSPSRRKPPEMRYDGNLVFKLVAISNPKVVIYPDSTDRECGEIASCWAPDGGPYVGRKLSRGFFYSHDPSQRLPDKMLHFELSGEGHQVGYIYIMSAEGLDSTLGLIGSNGRLDYRHYALSPGSDNQLVLPYYSGGKQSSKIIIALTESAYKTIGTFKPPVNISTKRIDQEFDELWSKPQVLKSHANYREQTKQMFPLAKGSWGSVDLRISNSYTRYVGNQALSRTRPVSESSLRKHSVHVQFKPSGIPLKHMVRTTIKTSDGKTHNWINDDWQPAGSMADSGPKLEDIESIEIATCPFKTYTLESAALQKDLKRFTGAVIGEAKPNASIRVPGVATVESIGVYHIGGHQDHASQWYTPDGKPWYDHPGEDSYYNRDSPLPYSVYEVWLNLDKKLRTAEGDLAATLYSIPTPSSPTSKLRPLDFAMSLPATQGKMKLTGEPKKGDRFFRIDFDVANASWKSIGKTSKYIAHENKLLDENREWVHKWMNLTPFQYWLDDAGELVLSFTEPRKAPKPVKTGIKLPSRNYQVRYVLSSNSNQRLMSRPSWLPKSGGAWLSFDLNEERKAVYSSDGNRIYLEDLKSIELQARPITKRKPILLKLPPPVQRSKTVILEVR